MAALIYVIGIGVTRGRVGAGRAHVLAAVAARERLQPSPSARL